MTSTLTATVAQKFGVAGMTCGHCETAVATALFGLDGVTRVVVDVPAGSVVTESVAPLTLKAIAAALDDAGYRLA